jgi:hypothetical protein
MPPATSTRPSSNKLAVGMERGDVIMPVAVNVPVALDEVDEFESPFPPQEISNTGNTKDANRFEMK